MPKKSNSKNTKPVELAVVAEKEKPKKLGTEIDEIFAGKKRKKPENKEKSSSTGAAAAAEIDEIFAGKKRKKPENQQISSTGAAAAAVTDRKKLKKNKEKSGGVIMKGKALSEPARKPRKKTADGYTLYTEEELGIGKSNAGGTPLCPFDCDCCF